MKCPACLKDVKDGLIICPYCNTQFDFQQIKHVDTTLSDDSIDVTSSVNYERADIIEQEKEEVEELIDYNPKVEVPTTPVENTTNVFAETTDITNVKYENNLVTNSQIQDAKPLEEISFEQQQQIRNVNLEQAEDKKRNKSISLVVSSFGFVILLGLVIILIMYFKNNNVTNEESTTKTTTNNVEKEETTTKVFESKNKGEKSGYKTPNIVGSTVLASINMTSDDYVNVDVTLNKYLSSYDAYLYATGIEIEEGFQWYGMDVTITFNDLEEDIKYDPSITKNIYDYNGMLGTIKYQNKDYPVRIKTIYNGGFIQNGESANLKVVYALPAQTATNYIICFGDNKDSLGCFINES